MVVVDQVGTETGARGVEGSKGIVPPPSYGESREEGRKESEERGRGGGGSKGGSERV